MHVFCIHYCIFSTFGFTSLLLSYLNTRNYFSAILLPGFFQTLNRFWLPSQQCGSSALTIAIDSGHEDIAIMLLRAGAKANTMHKVKFGRHMSMLFCRLGDDAD